MLYVPFVAKLVVQDADFVFPDPASATAPHPEIAFPPFLNATVPVGAVPVTEAVNVTA
jgi:hypothetical protein